MNSFKAWPAKHRDGHGLADGICVWFFDYRLYSVSIFRVAELIIMMDSIMNPNSVKAAGPAGNSSHVHPAWVMGLRAGEPGYEFQGRVPAESPGQPQAARAPAPVSLSGGSICNRAGSLP